MLTHEAIGFKPRLMRREGGASHINSLLRSVVVSANLTAPAVLVLSSATLPIRPIQPHDLFAKRDVGNGGSDDWVPLAMPLPTAGVDDQFVQVFATNTLMDVSHDSREFVQEYNKRCVVRHRDTTVPGAVHGGDRHTDTHTHTHTHTHTNSDVCAPFYVACFSAVQATGDCIAAAAAPTKKLLVFGPDAYVTRGCWFLFLHARCSRSFLVVDVECDVI